MRRYGVVLVSAIGFLVSGCMVGPRYAKPTIPVTVAQPGDDLIRGK